MQFKILALVIILAIGGWMYIPADDMMDAIKHNMKECLDNAKCDEDKIMCRTQSSLYIKTCFDKDGRAHAYLSPCSHILNQYLNSNLNSN